MFIFFIKRATLEFSFHLCALPCYLSYVKLCWFFVHECCGFSCCFNTILIDDHCISISANVQTFTFLKALYCTLMNCTRSWSWCSVYCIQMLHFNLIVLTVFTDTVQPLLTFEITRFCTLMTSFHDNDIWPTVYALVYLALKAHSAYTAQHSLHSNFKMRTLAHWSTVCNFIVRTFTLRYYELCNALSLWRPIHSNCIHHLASLYSTNSVNIWLCWYCTLINRT